MKTLAAAAVAVAMLTFAPAAHAEKQPHMHQALKHLREAKAVLEKASHDKGGHRVEAIKLIDEAIKKVQEGIDFDNKH